MNVLSLFDGISCGQIALERAGISVDNYYASEIDRHAISVTKHNYPNTIQLGDVTKINVSELPKIDLLIGGSPCQGFSQSGKLLNFDDPRSKLFFEYVRILEDIRKTNPDVLFLLENVKMKREYQDVITKYLGVSPVLINSNLVSAQNRARLYWTNIPDIQQPEDKKLFFSDVMDSDDSSYQYWSSDQMSKWKNNQYIRKDYYRIEQPDSKVQCLMAQMGMNEPKTWHNGIFRKLTPIEWERLQTVPDGYTNVISTNQRKKCLGNGWTVDVISHIFDHIRIK